MSCLLTAVSTHADSVRARVGVVRKRADDDDVIATFWQLNTREIQAHLYNNVYRCVLGMIMRNEHCTLSATLRYSVVSINNFTSPK